jgi:tetratricopeptide (TPR) repeat protein
MLLFAAMRLLYVLPFVLAASPVIAQTVDFIPEIATSREEQAAHERCLADAEKNPAEGFEKAMAWRDATGSNAARHCVAAALFHIGQPAASADRLEQLGIGMRAASPEVRARILDQAGIAWLAARELERANAVLTTAIGMAPNQPDLYVDRAAVLSQASNYWEAIDDLNKALELEPRYGVALAFRAAAYRYVDSLDLALDDAEAAIRVAPDLPEGWLERGILRRLRGNIPGARADWLRVLVLEPDSLAGDAARANIERLELRLEDKPANLPARAGRR